MGQRVSLTTDLCLKSASGNLNGVRRLLEAAAEKQQGLLVKYNQLHPASSKNSNSSRLDDSILDEDESTSTPSSASSSSSSSSSSWFVLGGKLNDDMLDINGALDDGDFALELAVTHGNVEIASLLLEYGADINRQDVHGLTPLICAVHEPTVEMMRLLIAAIPQMDRSLNLSLTSAYSRAMKAAAAATQTHTHTNHSPFKAAISTSTSTMTATATTATAPVSSPFYSILDPNVQDARGRTALMISASLGHVDQIRLFLLNFPLATQQTEQEQYASPKASSSSSLAATATSSSSTSTSSSSSSSSSIPLDLEKMDEDWNTALLHAVLNEHYECSKLLIVQGQANLFHRNKRGQAAIDLLPRDLFYSIRLLKARERSDIILTALWDLALPKAIVLEIMEYDEETWYETGKGGKEDTEGGEGNETTEDEVRRRKSKKITAGKQKKKETSMSLYEEKYGQLRSIAIERISIYQPGISFSDATEISDHEEDEAETEYQEEKQRPSEDEDEEGEGEGEERGRLQKKNQIKNQSVDTHAITFDLLDNNTTSAITHSPNPSTSTSNTTTVPTSPFASLQIESPTHKPHRHRKRSSVTPTTTQSQQTVYAGANSIEQPEISLI